MKKITRRNFLKNGLVGMGAIALQPFYHLGALSTEFPDTEKLGRICVGKVDLRARPSANSQSVGVLYEDMVVVWLRELLEKHQVWL